MDEKMKKYEVRQRTSDKKWCIYYIDWNVVVAEFLPGADADAHIINDLLSLLSEKEEKIEETEAERHRLSKLLIEARVRIVELKEGIEKIAKSEYMNSLVIKEKLRFLLKKE